MFKRYHLIVRLLPILRPYRGRFIALCLLTVLATLIGLFEPWPLAFLIDSVINQTSSYPSWVRFTSHWSTSGQILFAVVVGFGMTLLVHGIAVVIRAVDTRLELGMVLDMRSRIFAHVQKLSFQYHDQGVAAHYIFLVNELSHDAGSLISGLVPLAEAFLTLIGMFIITYHLDHEVALATAAVVPLIYFATTYYGKLIEPRLLEVRELEGQSIRIVHERLGIIRVVVSFCREKYEHARFYAQASQALNARVSVTIKQTVFTLVVALMTAAGTGAVLYLAANSVARKELTVGELTVILAYVRSVYRPIEQVTHTLTNMQMQLIRVEMLFESLDTLPEVRESPTAIALPAPRGRIEVQDLAFHYESRERTLEGVSFTLEPGEFVAVVGPTGAGKSTLMSMIPRFFDPHEGRVLIDGHDVRDLTIESVRNAVGLVLQEPLLFVGTMADNIRYGRLDATDDEVIEAAKMANCHDFIMSLPEGYETTVGERGARISGGERQRVAVARAFMKDAPILILDEPTSSIDSRTELVILDALERIAVGRTTIMIAHRLSTIRKADRILVMDDGRLVEQGSHKELLESDGLYAALWRAQVDDSGPPQLDAALDPDPEPDLPPAALIAPAPAPAGIFEATVRTESVTTFEPARRPKVVVLGMMTKIPVAGVVWQTMHYLVGLERLGVDAYYVEAHARTPSMFMEREGDDGSGRAAAFINDVMHRFGLDGRWAFHALHDDGAVYGMTRSQLDRLYAEADLIINLHGGTEPLPEHAATGRLVYLETDPVQLQIELFDQDPAAIRFLEPHVAFFTFGENYGRPDCGLPVSDRFRFLPTRQPVVRDFWESYGTGPARSFTTIGNWRQPWREVRFNGETYHWTKHLEFLKFIDVPRRTRQRFELGLSSYTEDDQAMLEAHGWHVVHALDFSIGIDSYRSYIGGSRGEFTVAKDQNVRLRTGWFSDRSATYLAAGLPVITQDTGFGRSLPTGEGLFAFNTVDEVVDAVGEINGDYDRHRRAALAISREYFDHDAVLRPLLTELGISVPRRRHSPAQLASRAMSLPLDLDLSVVGRHPTMLAPATTSTVLAAPLPELPADLPTTPPAVSIVVVTHDNLVFTRLCLESVLANTGRADVELIIVDNASTDMTPAYLDGLVAQSPRVRALRNDDNLGFAVAVNQGLQRARGDVLVLLNNDTVVAPGWLDRLERHLADPTVGMVGPLTNSCPNEARIDVPYRTYGEFLEFAEAHAGRAGASSFDIGVLTMFCVAFRRDVFAAIGPLDERFEIGMFEDDDYALRLSAAGLRSVCADDVVVHHFGEASLGKLVASGEYHRIFTANKERFEQKWSVEWETHRLRPSAEYVELVTDVRTAIATNVPPGATVLVVSKGDEDLLDVPGRTAWHFPRDEHGTYAGWYAGDTDELLADLREQMACGAQYLVVPSTASWWFAFYPDLEQRFATMFDEVERDAACRIFDLTETARMGEGVDA